MTPQQEQKCYGCSIEALDNMVARSKLLTPDPKMLAFSLLSDVQEMVIGLNDNYMVNEDTTERIRQEINRIKYILREHVK